MQKYQLHPDFPEEAGMYLEANGFKRSNNESSKHISFFTDSKAIVATGNSIQFLEMHDEESGHLDSRGFKVVATYSGIQNIPAIFEWMLLFHLTGFISIKDFLREARKEMIVVPFDVMNIFGNQAAAANY